MLRLVLRVVLLYVDGGVTRLCYASERSLARRTSLSPKQVRALLKQADQSGLIGLENMGRPVMQVVFRCDEVEEREARELWGLPKALARRADRGDTSPADDLLRNVRDPDTDREWTEEELESGEAWDYEERIEADGSTNRVYRDELHHTPRFYWVRELADSPVFARPEGQKRRSRMAAIKATAFAIDLLVDKNGLPYRWTSIAELCALAGFTDSATVRWAIAELERRGWIQVTRRPARGVGGLMIRLAWPTEKAGR